jgi:hypothetical protein
VRSYAAYTPSGLSGGYQYNSVLSKIGSTAIAEKAIPRKRRGNTGPFRRSPDTHHQTSNTTTMTPLAAVNATDGPKGGLESVGIGIPSTR